MPQRAHLCVAVTGFQLQNNMLDAAGVHSRSVGCAPEVGARQTVWV